MPSTITRFILTSALFLFAAPLHALQLDADGCRSLAQFVASAAQMRDIGANKDKHMAAVVKANAEQPPELLAFLKKALAGVYASKATPQELAEATMQMCLAQEGKLGEGEGAPGYALHRADRVHPRRVRVHHHG